MLAIQPPGHGEWGNLFPTFKHCYERDEGRNPSFFNNFCFQTLHPTSLPAGILHKTHGSHFIWENMCGTIRKAAEEPQKLELYGWNVCPLPRSALCIFKYRAILQIGGNREIPNLNVCSAKPNVFIGLLGLCTFLWRYCSWPTRELLLIPSGSHSLGVLDWASPSAGKTHVKTRRHLLVWDICGDAPSCGASLASVMLLGSLACS